MQESTFGERLRIAFDNATNAKIADKIGVGRSTVVNYLAGRIPEWEIVFRIKKVTGCDLDWLLTGDESRIANNAPHIGSKALSAKLESIADEQSRIVFSDVEIGGGNVREKTLDLLVEYLLARALVSFGLLGNESDVMNSGDIKRAQRFAFVQNQPQLLDDRIREMISNAMANETRFTVDTEERFRAIIRELVQEEVSNSRKRPVYPLRVAEALEDENLDETTRRKVG